MQPTQSQHTETDVRTFRQDVDALLQRLLTFTPSRELALVRTKLEEAKMWAGKELGNLGVQLPPQYADNARLGSQNVVTPQVEAPAVEQSEVPAPVQETVVSVQPTEQPTASDTVTA